MLHDSTQHSNAKWAAHLLTCRQNLYIARLGQLHPHLAQRVANEDHVRSLTESMEESAILKFQHPLEVVLDNDDVLLNLPPLSHLPHHCHRIHPSWPTSPFSIHAVSTQTDFCCIFC
jgi:hypothetical protein